MYVVIHGWWILLLVVLVGTFASMAATRFSWMRTHRVSGSSWGLKFLLKEFAKARTSLLRCSRLAFFQRRMVWGTGFFLLRRSSQSIWTAWWSPRPGRMVLDFVRSGQLVKKMSRVFFPRVGWSTIWRRPASLNVSRNCWLSFFG